MKLTLTIRRKLFLGFLAVVAAPLVMVVFVSRSYVSRSRTDLDQRFLERARGSFHRIGDRSNANLKLLNAVVHELAVSVKSGHAAGGDPQPPAFSIEINDDEKEIKKRDKKSEIKEKKERREIQEMTVHLNGVDRLVTHAIKIATKKHLLDHLVDLNDPKMSIALDIANRALDNVDKEDKEKAEIEPPVAMTLNTDFPKHKIDGLEETVDRLRREYPAIQGIEVRLDGEDQLQPCGIDFKQELWGAIDKVHAEGSTIWLTLPAGNFLFERFNSSDNASGVAAKIDPRELTEVAELSRFSRAFYVDVAQKAPWHTAAEAAEVTNVIPVRALADHLPPPGETATVVVSGGTRYRVYTASREERDQMVAPLHYPLVAVVAEAELYKPLFWFQVKQVAALLFSLFLAIGLSYYLSGRFVGAVENIQRGVDALSRGEFAQLQKLSGDELGSGLVESMNRMATVLQERTRKEEVEGWRRLVRVLSHEINNTLGPVRSVAVTVRDQVAPKLANNIDTTEATEDLQMAFRLIVDRVDSLSSFISGYAELAKLPAPARVHTDLNEVVRAAVRMLKQSADDKKIIVHEVYSHEVRAQLDGGQIERVAINLIKNAIEAAKSDVVVRTLGLSTGVELIVEDDGPGISPEARRMLFVPYFTTKPGGSGIGLALARQIALGHGGSINAEDRSAAEGGGTLLRVILPSSVAPAVNSEG